MTLITSDHVEWAVVGRLGSMLEDPPHRNYNVTQAYSLFTMILSWLVQHIRIPADEIGGQNDENARQLFIKLSGAGIAEEPWRIHAAPTARIETIGPYRVAVPSPVNFEKHTVARFLINLRDATAHGDARNVSPFNVAVGSGQLLAGFSFACTEVSRRQIIWTGKITLLEADMRRIGGSLARSYCDSLRRSEPHRHDSNFGSDAASVKEAAA